MNTQQQTQLAAQEKWANKYATHTRNARKYATNA